MNRRQIQKALAAEKDALAAAELASDARLALLPHLKTMSCVVADMVLDALDVESWRDSSPEYVGQFDRFDIVTHKLSDALSMAEVLEAMHEGNLDVAARLARCLDTIVRECIPNELYEFLEP